MRDHATGPPSVRKHLKMYGHFTVTGVTVCKTPVTRMLTKISNLLTLGRLGKSMRKQNFDSMFHLYYILHTSDGSTKRDIHMEKNARVLFSSKIPKQTDTTQCRYVETPRVTVEEWVSKTRSRMGKHFFHYSAARFNCQHFVTNSLKANDVEFDEELNKFVNQDVSAAMYSNPVAMRIVDGLTNASKRIEILMHGKGLGQLTKREYPLQYFGDSAGVHYPYA